MKRPEYTRDELAESLEYVGITRKETYNTIHYLERQGKLVRRKGKG